MFAMYRVCVQEMYVRLVTLVGTRETVFEIFCVLKVYLVSKIRNQLYSGFVYGHFQSYIFSMRWKISGILVWCSIMLKLFNNDWFHGNALTRHHGLGKSIKSSVGTRGGYLNIFERTNRNKNGWFFFRMFYHFTDILL